MGKCAAEVSIGFIVSVISVAGHPFAETVDVSMFLEDFPGVTITFINHSLFLIISCLNAPIYIHIHIHVLYTF